MNKVKAEYNEETDEFQYVCPNCGTTTIMDNLDPEEFDILQDEGSVEYFCDECSTHSTIYYEN